MALARVLWGQTKEAVGLKQQRESAYSFHTEGGRGRERGLHPATDDFQTNLVQSISIEMRDARGEEKDQVLGKLVLGVHRKPVARCCSDVACKGRKL
ncbi:hypothetical protein AV530_017185 [Patagioenas fasciata monilis]|uniref:Uncharacterized protein n=1 Tax=Patagioenas fasciata monilis TaxID=372326 RepID=A0A1V4JFG7_PATFA|nr:hypothetical protein AV530_017185 [Patagioenas fasciata monilis]